MPRVKERKAIKIKIKKLILTKAKKLNNNFIIAVTLCLFNL